MRLMQVADLPVRFKMKSQAMSASKEQTHRWWIPKRQTREELIDSFDQPMDDLRGTFEDIRRFNKLFGGTSMVLHYVDALMSSLPGELSILDIGTGLGDIPCALSDLAHRRGRTVQIMGLDANERVVQLASSFATGKDEIRFVTGDARHLPFPDNSFDIALCSLTMHHFDDATAASVIREMARVSRSAIVVSDLRRAYLPAALIWTISRVFFLNRLSQHDAHLSVLRSRTIPEYRDLSLMAGLQSAKVYKHPFWRAAIVWRKS